MTRKMPDGFMSGPTMTCRACGHRSQEVDRSTGLCFACDKEPNLQLETVSEKALKLIWVSLKRLERDMDATSEHLAENLDAPYRPQHAEQAISLARGLANLNREIRQMLAENRRQVDKMSPREKGNLIVTFFPKLPREVQRDVLERLVKLHKGGREE